MNDSLSLADRVRSGDADALAEYIEEHRPQLLAFVQKNMSDALARQVEPADILSEAAINALTTLDKVDLGERDPFGWLCQLCERRIIDAFRYHKAQKRDAAKTVSESGSGSEDGELLDLLVTSMTSPSQHFSRDQKAFRVQVAISQLPPDQKDALRMKFVDQLSSKEIAERLDKTDGAVRVMVKRTLERLQQLLRDETLFQSYVVESSQEE